MTKTMDRMMLLADCIINEVKKIPQISGKRSKYYFQRVERPLDIKKAMIDAGYSPRYAEAPQRVLARGSFQEVLATRISQDDIISAQKTNLEAKNLQAVSVVAGLTEEDARAMGIKLGGEFAMFSAVTYGRKQAFFIVPYHKIIDSSLDKLYKLAGEYAPDRLAVVTRPFSALTDEELAEQTAEARKRFNKE